MSKFLKCALLLSFPIVGCGLFAGGVIYRGKLKQRVAGFLRIEGIVVSNREGIGSGEGPSYHPIVKYRVGHRLYSVEGSVGYGSKKATGSSMTVMYDPSSPATAFLVTDYYSAAYVLMFLGGMFMVFGSYFASVLWDASLASE